MCKSAALFADRTPPMRKLLTFPTSYGIGHNIGDLRDGNRTRNLQEAPRKAIRGTEGARAKQWKFQKMKRADILQQAERLITGDRAKEHGDARANFAKVAKMWSAMVGVEITPRQVPLMMVVLKVVRACDNPGNADNCIDAAGYAALAGELAGE